MTSFTGGYGAEINELLAHLERITVPAPATPLWLQIRNLQRRIDGKNSLLLGEQRRRARLVADRNWVESDIHGFEQALTLVGGPGGDTPGAVRLERRLATTTARVDELSTEIDEIDARIRRIEADVLSAQQQLVDVLRHTVDDAEEKVRAAKQARIRRKTALHARAVLADETPMWSPTAVLGYRVWIAKRDGLYGAWERWETPHLVAVCDAGDDVPHTDGRCADVGFGCGIYAAKDPATLLDEIGVTVKARYAVGLVGLEGKVVEHERGYRAEKATVLALAANDHKWLRFIDDPGDIAAAFGTRPRMPRFNTDASITVADTASLRIAITTYLENQTRRRTRWTSANPNG